MIYITRKEHFCASHKLYVQEWSEEKNREIFGKCSNPNGHGHNYSIYVTVKGEVDSKTGFLINLKIISKLIQDYILEKIDHKDFNLDVEFMKGIIPTTENITREIWRKLEGPINELSCQLHCIKLQETEKNYAEYYGE
ncbi:MAG TPA: 6-carboxytetrahydropterin synthase [Flavobacteriales bacterium]|nr:6-carboxytetrahydropterin synthase [Flavobacteriales bacterium]HIN39354.1 6-carboxytetrahydropterin synthase [Flavobacteriales bacterium]